MRFFCSFRVSLLRILSIAIAISISDFEVQAASCRKQIVAMVKKNPDFFKPSDVDIILALANTKAGEKRTFEPTELNVLSKVAYHILEKRKNPKVFNGMLDELGLRQEFANQMSQTSNMQYPQLYAATKAMRERQAELQREHRRAMRKALVGVIVLGSLGINVAVFNPHTRDKTLAGMDKTREVSKETFQWGVDKFHQGKDGLNRLFGKPSRTSIPEPEAESPPTTMRP